MSRYAVAATDGGTPLLLNITMSKRRKACEPSHVPRTVLLIILMYSDVRRAILAGRPRRNDSVLYFVQISSTLVRCIVTCRVLNTRTSLS